MNIFDRSRRDALKQFTMIAAAFGAGCSRIPLSQQIGQAFTTKLPNASEYPTTREKITATPYASLGVQFRGQPKVVMILATADGPLLNWVSSNHAMISTLNGVIVSTRGLPMNLLKTDQLTPDPLAKLTPGDKIDSGVFRKLTFGSSESNPQEEVLITSRYKNLGEDSIEILGERKKVWLVEEAADYRAWRWQVINKYWLDPRTRFIWRSRQQLVPDIEELTLEVLKPYV